MIPFYPELKRLTRSTNAALLLQQHEHRFAYQPDGFYKFLEPCRHRDYRPGDSWCEELECSLKELRGAFEAIRCIRYRSSAEAQAAESAGKLFDSPDGPAWYCTWYDRNTGRTEHRRNHAVVDAVLLEAGYPPMLKKASDKREDAPSDKRADGGPENGEHVPKGQMPICQKGRWASAKREDVYKEQIPNSSDNSSNTESSSHSDVSEKAPRPSPAGGREDVDEAKARKAEGRALQKELRTFGYSEDEARDKVMKDGLGACRQLLALLLDLAGSGVGARKARKLVEDFGELACRQQLDWLPYRENVDKPGAYLAWAIRDGKSAPQNLPPPARSKLEAQQASRQLQAVPIAELDSSQLYQLGRQLWPGFAQAAAQGLAALDVPEGPGNPLAPLTPGSYPLHQLDGSFEVETPEGRRLALSPQLLPLFEWPGKTLPEVSAA